MRPKRVYHNAHQDSRGCSVSPRATFPKFLSGYASRHLHSIILFHPDKQIILPKVPFSCHFSRRWSDHNPCIYRSYRGQNITNTNRMLLYLLFFERLEAWAWAAFSAHGNWWPGLYQVSLSILSSSVLEKRGLEYAVKGIVEVLFGLWPQASR